MFLSEVRNACFLLSSAAFPICSPTCIAVPLNSTNGVLVHGIKIFRITLVGQRGAPLECVDFCIASNGNPKISNISETVRPRAKITEKSNYHLLPVCFWRCALEPTWVYEVTLQYHLGNNWGRLQRRAKKHAFWPSDECNNSSLRRP